jgi:hypothetical protein
MVRGQRVAARFRAQADRALVRMYTHLGTRATRMREQVSRETVVKILHMGTYVVLLFVRILERKLTKASSLLRTVRKKQRHRATSPRVDTTVPGVDGG